MQMAINKNLTFLFTAIQILCTILQARAAVIVDTDMGLDDVRATILLLQMDSIDIKAIITSDGSSSPWAGYWNVQRILKYFQQDSIPVGVGEELYAPLWREKSNTLGWAEFNEYSDICTELKIAHTLLTEIVEKSLTEITYICLGPMTNLSRYFLGGNREKGKIRRILYFGSSPSDSIKSWNTQRDLTSAKHVFSCTVPITFFNSRTLHLLPFDSSLYESICSIESRAAELIEIVHKDNRVQKLFGTGHSMIWDEMISLFLFSPSMFEIKPVQESKHLFEISDWKYSEANKNYLALLRN